MDKKLVREVMASGSATLREFAQAVNSTAGHLYSVLVKQQSLSGVMMLLSLAYFIPSTIWIVTKIWDRYAEEDAEEAFWGSALLILLNFIIIVVIDIAIMKIINPEYYAIKFIFKGIKGM